MKKLLLISIVAAAFNPFYGQSLRIIDDLTNADVTNKIDTVYVQANNLYQVKFKIQNTTSTDVYYKVERVFLTPPLCNGTIAFFCAAGQCYPPDTTVSQFSQNDTIKANQTLPSGPNTFGIDTDFDIGPTCCSEDILYKIHNINNPNDFVTVTLRYLCTVGIDDNENIQNISFNAYPSPSNAFVNIKYNLKQFIPNSKLIIYDIQGKAVREINITEKIGQEKIDATEFSGGIYFFSLVIDGKAIKTEKIIIESK